MFKPNTKVQNDEVQGFVSSTSQDGKVTYIKPSLRSKKTMGVFTSSLRAI